MNDIIQYVKEKNKIKENFVPSVSTFNGDRVFLSNNYVIKLFDEKSSQYYKNELFAYENMSKEHVAEMIEVGEYRSVNYILMKRIKGKSLYSIWDYLEETEKEKIVSQISNILKGINSLKVDKQINFKEFLRNEYKTWFEKLKVNENLKGEIDKSFNKNIQYIDENEKNFWCYFDNHFDNYIYDEKRIKIIDFEDLRKGPIDYQLDVWNRMSKYPTLFANEIESKHIKSGNFKNITKLLSKYYPEIYSNKHINQRLQLYSLLYDIRIIVKYNLKDHVLIKRLNEDMYGDIVKT